MEPPRGVWASLCHFILFLPFFIGLLILGLIKGIIIFPVIFLILAAGILGVLLGFWPVHCFYTYYCILSTKQFGPSLKLILCILVLPVILISWSSIGIAGGLVGSAAYALLAPMFATFHAVGEGKDNKLYHCICDGTWSSVKRSITIIRDFLDVCYHSYFSIMGELCVQGSQEGKYYEIRLQYFPLSLIAGILGVVTDILMITIIAVCKSPYMLVKGWHRLFHDCIGREGPFLETICVPFAGLAILLWPFTVAVAVLGSVMSSVFLGAYAAVIVYQEGSFWFGLCYIIASLAIYDEYSNDILDMPEGSCFPRPRYRKKNALQDGSFSKHSHSKNPSSHRSSLNSSILELKPLELVDALFEECEHQGEILALEGIITVKDIKDAKNNKNLDGVIGIGLTTYCLFQSILRSVKADSAGILLRNDTTEITSSNRPKDTFFDWFLEPILIIKEQIKADNLSQAEEEYLGKLILFSGDAARFKNSITGPGPESELRRAELDAFARRLQGIMKSIARYPSVKRRLESSLSNILEGLAKKHDGSTRSVSNGGNIEAPDLEAHTGFDRDAEEDDE